MNFTKFQAAVSNQFESMRKSPLFCIGVEHDEIWQTYLSSFPEGSNPIFREKTIHDCNCCKRFIRKAGGIVSIVNGKLISLWDIKIDDPVYQVVADKMAALVKGSLIAKPFIHYEKEIGVDKNFSEKDGVIQKWEHFHIKLNLPGSNFFVSKKDIGKRISDTCDDHKVFLRSLREIDRDAVDTVLALCSPDEAGVVTLYRGAENKHSVETFRALQGEFDKLRYTWEKDIFVWSKIYAVSPAVLRIRNTAIGTLLVDLSEGKPIEDAVGAYEFKVAPMNYKRPTALVTKAMVDKAKKTIEELGLTSALERRYAYLTDISVRDILFVDRGTRKQLKDDIWANIASNKAFANLDAQKYETVPIEEFIQTIIPQIDSLEVMVENSHTGNFVSLIAPVDPDARHLFKWNNNFSWSYTGDLADSIKERVKQAGGNVTGELCCRLAWYNYDDLDFHMKEPYFEIHYGTPFSHVTKGQLDVDMNAGMGTTRTPVENIFYKSLSTMAEGKYTLFVHQFSRRESENIGFEVEIDVLGTVYNFAYTQALRHGEKTVVADFIYSKREGLKIIPVLPSSKASRSIWNVNTNKDFHKVNVLMLSPNFWNGEGIGNKHYFFMLEDCFNDGKARGFYNEFLKSELDPHRKVIEIVGSKMKTEESQNQLSGLGFSSTQRNSLLCRVKGSFTRVIKVTF